MSTHTQIIYQIVYSTKNREKCLTKKYREPIFKYIGGILKNKNCHLYIVNGVEDHLHVVTHIHPIIALASLIKDIKISCNGFIKEKLLIPDFPGWQDGYGAFTYSYDAVPNLVRYVQNQETHHGSISFEEEYRGLLDEHGIEYDEKYLF
ncbi:MAG: transposase [Saprospiraceae bacterium]